MYTHKHYFKKPLVVVSFLFLFIGITFISISLVSTKLSENFKEHAIEVEGVIEKISTDDVFVTFEADGEIISTRLNFYSSSMRPGDSIILLYDISDPYRVQTPSSKILDWIFIGTGVLLASLGFILLLFLLFKRNTKSDLLENGLRLNSEFINVGLDMKISSNYRHPFIVECRYKAPDGTFYTFYSDPIWQNPHAYLSTKYIPVYVHPNNYKKYYVDLSAVLPEELL